MEKNMSEPEVNYSDMIAAAKKESPSEYQDVFNRLMMDKVAAAVEAERINVAQNFFNKEEPSEEDETINNEDESNEDIEATAGSEG
jgi:hypothetical protein